MASVAIFLAHEGNERRLTYKWRSGRRARSNCQSLCLCTWQILRGVAAALGLGCTYQPACLLTPFSWYALQGVSPTDMIPLPVTLFPEFCPTHFKGIMELISAPFPRYMQHPIPATLECRQIVPPDRHHNHSIHEFKLLIPFDVFMCGIDVGDSRPPVPLLIERPCTTGRCNAVPPHRSISAPLSLAPTATCEVQNWLLLAAAVHRRPPNDKCSGLVKWGKH